MTDYEFQSLRAGDKISAGGYDISYDAIVVGSFGNYPDLIGVRIRLVRCEKRENADYVWNDYRRGAVVTEQNRSSVKHGWFQDGSRRE